MIDNLEVTVSDSLEFEVTKLALSPGDILVVRGTFYLPLADLHTHFNAALGTDVRLLFIDKDTDLSVLSKADIEAKVPLQETALASSVEPSVLRVLDILGAMLRPSEEQCLALARKIEIAMERASAEAAAA